MDELKALLAILLMSAADRACGNPRDRIGKGLAAPLYGAGAAIVLGHWFDATMFLYALGFLAARSIGLGNAVGPALTGQKPARFITATNPGPEWWQQGILLESAWLSLAFLGFLWGASIYLFAGFADPLAWKLIPICILALPASVYLARGDWGLSEYLRGGLIGSFLYLA